MAPILLVFWNVPETYSVSARLTPFFTCALAAYVIIRMLAWDRTTKPYAANFLADLEEG